MKALLLCGVAVIAAFPAVASAQDRSAPSGTESAPRASDGEIIVTAQKREERLQDVPVAISAYGVERRDELGILSIQDIAKFTPSVSFSEFPNRLFIRGVGRFTNQLGSDPGVATYVDGFYTSETTAIGGNPILVDRIEILRGPQGTLYGRNAIGGAANVISPHPTDDFTSEVRLVAGNYERLGAAATVSGPISSWLRFRATGINYHQGEGFLENIAGPDTYNRSHFYLGEGQLEADLGSRVTAWAKYQYFNSTGTPTFNNQIDPYNTTDYLGPGSLLPSATVGYTVPNPGTTDLFKSNTDYPGLEKIRNAHQVIGHLNVDLGGAMLKYIGGYQSFDYKRIEDYDRTSRAGYNPGPAFVSTYLLNTIEDDKRFYSHEINLTSDNDSALSYIFGLYYYHEKERQTYVSTSPNQPQLDFVLDPPTYATGNVNPDRSFIALAARQVAKSYAAFGQIDYKITPEITLTGGLRYTHDKKDGFESLEYTFFEPFTSPLYAFNATPALNARDISGSWEAISGKAGISYEPDRTTNFYANYSRGYKAGGFNLFSLTDPVGKETLDAFEVGLKKSVSDRLQVNLASYYYRYHDIQVPVTYVNVVVLPNFVNADKARSFGVEAEATWSPIGNLQALVSYSYQNAKFQEFCCYTDVTNPTAGAQDLAGNRLPQSPRHKITASLLNEFDLGGGTTVTPVATVNYTGEQYYSPFTTDKYRQDGYVRADFRLVFKTDDGLQLNAYVNNAFNNRSFNGFQLGPESQGFPRQVTINLPRTYGFELIGRF